jgi:gliding motility-associated-like protein
MLKKTVLSLLFFQLLSLSLWAQVDTEFWFAAPDISDNHADSPIYLRISTLQSNATIQISQPANSSFGTITLTLNANQTRSVDLTDYLAQIENLPANQILNAGLYIKSDNPITAYYEVLGSTNWGIGTNSDIFVLKGNHALGKEFYVPFQTYWDNNAGLSDAFSSFDIVASENNTLVTITPTKDLLGHAAGASYTVTLQKGQTYSARAASTVAAEHPTGSHITSSKPIAVTVKDDSMLENGSYDLAGDQIIPLDYIGKEYIAIKVSGTSNTDRLYVMATKPNTDIFLNGTGPVITLNAGEAYEIHLLSPTAYITSSDSIYVWHVAGFTNELGGAILPPLGCTGSRQVSFTRSTNEEFYIEIVVKTGYEHYFTLNGSTALVPAAVFNVVPGTGGIWTYTKIPLNATTIPAGSNNVIKNDSSDFQFSTLNGGATTGFRYGYFSDFGFLELGSDKGICEGDSTRLNAGFFKDSYLWNTGSTNQYITVKDSGVYKVTVTKGVCQMSDSTKVFYFPKITSAILGNDTAACSNGGLRLSTLSSFSSYLWNTGSTDPIIRPTTTGDYMVEVTNEYGCKKSDTIFVTLYPAPRPAIMYDSNLESFCKDSIVSLEANENFVSYIWSTGDTTKSITTVHNENDYFSLLVTNSYGCRRKTELQIDCSPVIGLVPNLLTPNEDGKNDIFYIEYLRHGKWIFEVYNRWGARVYLNNGYDNSFNPKELEDGIYYFSLRHKDGMGERKGWLQIIR